MNNDAGGYLDSTSGDNDMTGVSLTEAAIAGPLEHTATSMDGAADYINFAGAVSGPFDLTATLTLEGWFRNQNVTDDSRIYLGRWGNTSVNDQGYAIRFITSGDHQGGRFFADDGATGIDWTGTGTVVIDTFHYQGMTFNSAVGGELFFAGAPDGTQAFIETLDSNDTDFRIGAYGNATQFLHGQVQEVRVSDVVRSDNYFTTHFNNQNAPGTFWSVGAEEAVITFIPRIIMS